MVENTTPTGSQPTTLPLRSTPGLWALLALPGVGPVKADTITNRFNTFEGLASATVTDLEGILPADKATTLLSATQDGPAELPVPEGAWVLSKHDPGWPTALTNPVFDPPPILWGRGNLPVHVGVAVVGTRDPSPFGVAAAQGAAEWAVARGATVVAGCSLGVDTIAHRVAAAHGGVTFGVLGQGIDTIPAHGERAEAANACLGSGGGVVTEFPPGDRPAGWKLARRNRLQVAFAAGGAVFIAESEVPADDGTGAGTMHTAKYAISTGTTLIVACPPAQFHDLPSVAGNLALCDPAGCDPAVVHARTQAEVDGVTGRAPVADVIVRHRSELAGITLGTSPTTTGPGMSGMPDWARPA